MNFEWLGDPTQHALTVEPALRAFADPRLEGPRGEFEEALSKRRSGTPKDLEDAVDEAAKAVESTLQLLHDEHGVARTGTEAVLQLFISLRARTCSRDT
jgi:predicted Co/Zn/Cd cation transporter (cation efflux family)